MSSTRRGFLRVVPVALVAPLGGCGWLGSNPMPGALRVQNDDDRAHEVTATVVDGHDEGSSATPSVGVGGSSTSDRFIDDPDGETVRVTLDGENESTVETIPGGNVEVRIDPDGSFTLSSAHYD